MLLPVDQSRDGGRGLKIYIVETKYNNTTLNSVFVMMNDVQKFLKTKIMI